MTEFERVELLRLVILASAQRLAELAERIEATNQTFQESAAVIGGLEDLPPEARASLERIRATMRGIAETSARLDDVAAAARRLARTEATPPPPQTAPPFGGELRGP